MFQNIRIIADEIKNEEARGTVTDVEEGKPNDILSTIYQMM